jgi:hypothetical protein
MALHHASHDFRTDSQELLVDSDDLDGGVSAARGLLIGLAISQVFWLIVAYFVFR